MQSLSVLEIHVECALMYFTFTYALYISDINFFIHCLTTAEKVPNSFLYVSKE